MDRLVGTACLGATLLMVGCRSRTQALREFHDGELSVVVRQAPEPDGTRVIVSLDLAGQSACPVLQAGASATLAGREIVMFAPGGKLGDSLSKNGPSCFPPSFRSSISVADSAVVEVSDGKTRFTAVLTDLTAARTMTVEGDVLRAGRTASVTWSPANDTLPAPSPTLLFAYDAPAPDGSADLWSATAEVRAAGGPVRFAVPASAHAGAGTLSFGGGDSPYVLARPVRCVGVRACSVRVELERGHPATHTTVVRE